MGLVAMLALPGLAGCGSRRTAAHSVLTPKIHVSLTSVPSMPSAYCADAANGVLSVGHKKPWTITETGVSGTVLKSFWIPSHTRPKIIYVMPHALALVVTRPMVEELLLNTSTGRLVRLWQLPLAQSLYPASVGGFGDGTFFWKTTAGPQGPIATFGGYQMQKPQRLTMALAELQGNWYDDLSRGALLQVQGTLLTKWADGRWVAQGVLPSGAVDVISQHHWVMATVPGRFNSILLRWYNVKSGVGTTMRVYGSIAAAGADWALLLRGTKLWLAVPSTKQETLVAVSVSNPLTANDVVYWMNAQGQVRSAAVTTNVLSAVPDIMWP